MSTTLDQNTSHDNLINSRCPHCGQRYPDEAPTTTVHCGKCDRPRELKGTKQSLAGITFGCEACGAQNIVPEPEGVAD